MIIALILHGSNPGLMTYTKPSRTTLWCQKIVVTLCDDYGFPGYKNATKAAIDEFFKDKPENPITLQTRQCFIIKL